MKPHLYLMILVLFLLSQGGLPASSLCVSVLDPAELPLRAVAVKAVNLLNTERRFSALTNPQGRACIDLPVGLYSVEASLSGFLNVRYYPVRVTFPHGTELSFTLPLGEVMEGPITAESVLSGTLLDKGEPVEGVKMCLFAGSQAIPAACTTTNDLGEYALVVPADVYWLEFSRPLVRMGRIKVDLSNAGTYRNRVSLPVLK